MVDYTVAVCNYNMAETIERSLRSILNQIDDRFEVLVIDDGSTDGSLSILKRLSTEFDQLRVIISDNDNVGEARAESIKQARGDYVLPQLDTDDIYDKILLDFVELYHQIEDQVDRDFFLKGRSINMAPTELLRDIQYRPFGYGEDKDLWRRLFADDRVIWIRHASPCQSIGYKRGLLERATVTYEITSTHFRSGITLNSFLKYKLQNPSLRSLVQVSIAPIAFISATQRGRFDLPKEYEKMGRLEKEIQNSSKTVEDLEADCGLEVDWSQFSETGRRLFRFEAD